MAKKVNFDTLRTIAHGSISGTYAAIGSAYTVQPRIIVVTNNTDGDMIVSDDNTNASGKLFVAAGSFKLFDFTANMVPGPNGDDSFVQAIGTTMYVKQSTAPSKGAVYLELIYGT